MTPPLPLSVAIITCNEEFNLPRCLASIKDLAAEIVVVDSGSKDRTLDVANSYGAHVFHQDWLGFRDQRAASLSKCSQPWVLALDADEELSDPLRQEIQSFFASQQPDAYSGASFPRKVLFLGRWITHGDWYPDRKLRLVRRDFAQCVGEAGHDKIEITGGGLILEMRADLHHYSFPTVSRYISKINTFSDAHLETQVSAGRKWSLAHSLFRPWWRFFRAYVLRRGFLDGFPGFWIATATAFQAFVRHSRLYEYEANARTKSKSLTKEQSGDGS